MIQCNITGLIQYLRGLIRKSTRVSFITVPDTEYGEPSRLRTLPRKVLHPEVIVNDSITDLLTKEFAQHQYFYVGSQ